jgi:hypothetical protein
MKKKDKPIISIENAIKGFEAIEELYQARQKEEEKLYKKYKCRRWLIVPEPIYEELLGDESIKKRDIEEGSCSAYIRTIENLGAFQWVRMYKRKQIKLMKDNK